VTVSVLFLAERYLPEWGGGGELSGALVAELVSRIPGYRTSVLTQGDGGMDYVNGVTVHRTIRRAPTGVPDDLSRGPLLTARAAPSIARAARDADVVHCLSPRAIPAVVAGARLAGVPATSVMNDNWATCFLHTHVRRGRLCTSCTPEGIRECLSDTGGNVRAAPLLLRQFRGRIRALNDLSAVVAVVPSIKRQLEQCGARPPVTFIPNPVDLSSYAGVHAREAEPGLVVFVGRLSTGKGVPEAVGAFAAAAKARGWARMEVVGDGPALGDSRRRARELGVEDRVAFVGFRPPGTMPEVLSRAQVVLAPFVRAEAFGRVGFEAAAAGRPVLTTGLWGGVEVLHQTPGAGVVVPWDDQSAWATALGEMLDDPARCAAMGREARKRVEALYAGDALQRAYRAFFEGVIGQTA